MMANRRFQRLATAQWNKAFAFAALGDPNEAVSEGTLIGLDSFTIGHEAVAEHAKSSGAAPWVASEGVRGDPTAMSGPACQSMS